MVTVPPLDWSRHWAILLQSKMGARSVVVLETASAHAPGELVPIDSITIPDQEPRGRIPRERFHVLLPRPGCTRARRHVEVEDSSPVIAEDEEHEEHSEGDCRDREAEAICPPEARSLGSSLEDTELVAKREVLDGEGAVRL